MASLLFLSGCGGMTDKKQERTEAGRSMVRNVSYESELSSYGFVKTIPVPGGFERIPADSGSFSFFLRNIPLKESTTVYLYNGKPKYNQYAHFAILDIDVGEKDLQQCADAVIRLRAEYLYKHKKYDEIKFNFTSGDEATFVRYAEGYRATIDGSKVSWSKKANTDYSYKNFKSYLQLIFTYAGSYSLSKELRPVKNKEDIKIGDVFIQGGFPGHAVIVMDMAIHKETGEKVFMLAQSYMPAQDIHILQNGQQPDRSPWYSINFDGQLHTPEWVFYEEDLKRF